MRDTRELHPLTRWRNYHGWTQVELAQASGLSQNHIATIEIYQRIPVRESLGRLLDVTGLPTNALVHPEHFLAANPNFLRPGRPPKA
jgi:transcriptional regulator with XRE-family HTH domain